MDFDVNKIALSILFSIFGLAFFRYGKRQSAPRFLVLGMLLMSFTYFVDSITWTVIIGIGLLTAPLVMHAFGL